MTEYDFSNITDFSADFGGESEPKSVDTVAVSMAVVDSDDAVRNYLASLFDNAKKATSATEVRSLIGDQPHVVILGPSCTVPDELETIARWEQEAPNIGSILVTTELSTQLLHKALRIGIDDVIAAPIDEAVLSETVSRISAGMQSKTSSVPDVLADAPPDQTVFEPKEMGRAIAVFSTKGGSGKSITASNLAILLAQSSPDPVVLLDGHLQFGDQEVMLKLHAKHTVVDAMEQIDKADASFIKDLMTVHEATGLMVLPAPREPTFADQITGKDFERLVKLCQMFAGHVVIDLPAFFNEAVISTLELSNDIVLVAGLDIPNIKNVKIGLRTLALLGITEERIQLVLNRADSKVKLDVGEVEKTLGSFEAIRVPSDVVVPISVNKGSPVVLSAPRSGVARAFQELGSRFSSNVNVSAASTPSRRKFFG